MMSSLFYPLITFVLVLVCVAYWGTTALYPFTLFTKHAEMASNNTDWFNCCCGTEKKSLVLNTFVDISPLQVTPSTK